jgi:diamine N-acetyltransferase
MILEGAYISLRALEPEDLDFLFQVENNTQFWEVSHTQAPFSKHLLKQYLENSHLDIYESKQLRLMIVEKETEESVE